MKTPKSADEERTKRVCRAGAGCPASRRIVLPLARCDATQERTRAAGFPITVQLVACYGDEATLFRLSA